MNQINFCHESKMSLKLSLKTSIEMKDGIVDVTSHIQRTLVDSFKSILFSCSLAALNFY